MPYIEGRELDIPEPQGVEFFLLDKFCSALTMYLKQKNQVVLFSDNIY
jgi:hypothetical protein